jgi:multimeric flavodoxin WrbA
MKAVILFGSPRKDGNTMQLASAFSEVLRRRGDSVRMLYLNDMNIRPCQGCLTCAPKGICRINDDMKDIWKYVMESDLLVYATPIYWFAPSAQLKSVIDRSIAFVDEDFNSRIKGKKAVTLMTCASEDPETFGPALGMFRKTFELLGLSYDGGVEASACEDKGDVKEEFREKAVKVAESFS